MSNNINDERIEKDLYFKTSPDSPLTPEQQAVFENLNYYPYNPDLDFTVTVEPLDDPLEVAFPTTSGDTKYYRRFGRFTVNIEGQDVELTLYQADHGFFLPFVDANAGGETYSAGRYLDPVSFGNNQFRIDFNYAYNPYCAYNHGWSCPLTPAENRLKVAIRAGEKSPDPAWSVVND